MITRNAIPAHWIRPKRVVRAHGHRGSDASDLQIVCGVGPYEIDVLVRELAVPDGLDVTGQVTRAENLHEPIPSLPLALIQASLASPVGQARTDEFGEFAFGHQQKAAYGLRLGSGPDAPCVLVWDGGL